MDTKPESLRCRSALAFFGAIMLRFKPENKKAWGILIIVFSITQRNHGRKIHNRLHFGHSRRIFSLEKGT
jgi:hypothetical protein